MALETLLLAGLRPLWVPAAEGWGASSYWSRAPADGWEDDAAAQRRQEADRTLLPESDSSYSSLSDVTPACEAAASAGDETGGGCTALAGLSVQATMWLWESHAWDSLAWDSHATSIRMIQKSHSHHIHGCCVFGPMRAHRSKTDTNCC